MKKQILKSSHIICALLSLAFGDLFAQQQPNIKMIAMDDLADYPVVPKFNNVKTRSAKFVTSRYNIIYRVINT